MLEHDDDAGSLAGVVQPANAFFNWVEELVIKKNKGDTHRSAYDENSISHRKKEFLAGLWKPVTVCTGVCRFGLVCI